MIYGALNIFQGQLNIMCSSGANRKRSERDGLFIYLTPEMHNMSDKGIHFNQPFMDYAHYKGQLAWMEYYNKTKEDFIKEYGRNYI